jgi:UDP-glucose 4-epimerase
MRTELGFEPTFTTAEAFADFCRELSSAGEPRAREGAGRA